MKAPLSTLLGSWFAGVAAALALAGCNLVSDRPLLDDAEALHPFGNHFAVVALNETGEIALDDDANPLFLEFRRDDRSYRGVLRNREDVYTVSFHDMPGGSGLMLIQFSPQDAAEVSYFALRSSGDRIEGWAMDLDPEDRDILRDRGIAVEPDFINEKVSTRADLMATAAYWAQTRGARLDTPEEQTAPFRLARGPQEIAALWRETERVTAAARQARDVKPAGAAAGQ